MNNYQVHQRLERDFKLGSKVLRINQISGWITSEIKRRKNVAMAAVADAANMVGEALQKGVSAKLDGVFEAHTDRVLLPANDFEAAVAIGMNPEVNLEKWKHNWRWVLFPARRQEQPQRLAAEEEQRQDSARGSREAIAQGCRSPEGGKEAPKRKRVYKQWQPNEQETDRTRERVSSKRATKRISKGWQVGM